MKAGNQDTQISKRILAAGVKELREFGYPDCNTDNIMSVAIYRAFFRKMVEGTIEASPHGPAARTCKAMLAEMDALDAAPKVVKSAKPKTGKGE